MYVLSIPRSHAILYWMSVTKVDMGGANRMYPSANNSEKKYISN